MSDGCMLVGLAWVGLETCWCEPLVALIESFFCKCFSDLSDHSLLTNKIDLKIFSVFFFFNREYYIMQK